MHLFLVPKELPLKQGISVEFNKNPFPIIKEFSCLIFLLISFSIISILSKLPVTKRDEDKLDPYFFIQEIDSLEISLFLENPR